MLINPKSALGTWLRRVGALVIFTGVATAQTFTMLNSFGTNSNVGWNPYATLLQGTDGSLYGTTYGGVSNVLSTVFKLQPDGSGFTILKAVTNSAEGINPYGGLTLSDGVLYGMTYRGGTSLSNGTIYKVNTDGSGYNILHEFDFTNGANSYATLALSNGVLYGTTFHGGISDRGTVFKINTDGTGFTVLKKFIVGEGRNPRGGVILSGGVLYGTTYRGGSSDYGTVFKLNTDGTGYTLLKNFLGAGDAGGPMGSLVLIGGVLYGATWFPYGTVYKVDTNGGGFGVLLSGVPCWGGVTLSGGLLYGTTSQGGNSDGGTVFKLNTDGSGYRVLKDFTNSTEGAYPFGGVVFLGGALYGTTRDGGSSGGGTVFKVDLSIPLVVQSLGNAISLSWNDPGFVLQAAPAVTGVYTNIPGAQSPHTNTTTAPQKFFRLIGN